MLRKRDLTPAQKEYQQLDKRTQIIFSTLIALFDIILACFIGSFCFADKNPAPLLISFFILILYTIITIFIGRHLVRKQRQLYVVAYGDDTDCIRTGLFGDLWQEFEWNQFDGLTDGEVAFAETHNNTIDLQIIRKKHEFDICIDCEGVCMICDEETDTPIEKEIALSNFKDVGEVLLAIRAFVETNS